MDVKKIKRRKGQKRSVHITIRVTPDISKWLKENDFSPTGIFHEAIKMLGYEEEAAKENDTE